MKNGTLRLDAPALVTKDGEVVHSPPLICRRLIEILPQWRSFFLGCNEAESSEITAIRTQIK